MPRLNLRWDSPISRSLTASILVVSIGLVAQGCAPAPADDTSVTATDSATQQIMRGRELVLEHACSGCHGGVFTPDAQTFLVGVTSSRPDLEFLIGPCAFQKGAQPCFRTRPRNLTPDNLTGLGRFTERQIFNALRFGLRPGETPDVEITSMTPGEGNFPAAPKYLAPPMPWPAWRHMPDEDLWAIAAYLKNGVAPVDNLVADSEGPPDFWVGMMGEFLAAMPYETPAFPTGNEVNPTDPSVLEQVMRGRQVVIQHDCGACHGGGTNPANDGWLQGAREPSNPAFPVGLPAQPPVEGVCAQRPDPASCWMMRPANLTPHDTTGTGRYTDRQVFNALRFGLRPSTTPDVEVTSSTPGLGNFPQHPDYLGLGMPWPAWRFMSDADLRAVIAYLKHGLKPVDNKVPASDAPADLWASEYTVDKIGPYPAPAYPTRNEVRR
jgi:mono/diheme cytochrome c family protein